MEPITGGSIFGSALNATVKGGVAYPSIFDNGTLQDAFITTYGTTVDGAAFLVQVTGIGKPTEQFSSIVSRLFFSCNFRSQTDRSESCSKLKSAENLQNSQRTSSSLRSCPAQIGRLSPLKDTRSPNSLGKKRRFGAKRSAGNLMKNERTKTLPYLNAVFSFTFRLVFQTSRHRFNLLIGKNSTRMEILE